MSKYCFLTIFPLFKMLNTLKIYYKNRLVEKQCRPRSVCSSRSSLIRIYTICHFGHPTASKVHTVGFLRQFFNNIIFHVFQLLELCMLDCGPRTFTSVFMVLSGIRKKTVIPWFVRLYEEIIHEFSPVYADGLYRAVGSASDS